jgi:hypothetical protein
MMRNVAVLAAALAAAIPMPAGAGTTAAPAGTAVTLPAPLPPREAGARYGQALGVALICYGLRTTSALDRLPSQYAGDARTEFDSESEKTVAAWRETGSCKKAGGPNACRLVHEWSCHAALNEIGPDGSVLPGLVEQKAP